MLCLCTVISYNFYNYYISNKFIYYLIFQMCNTAALRFGILGRPGIFLKVLALDLIKKKIKNGTVNYHLTDMCIYTNKDSRR